MRTTFESGAWVEHTPIQELRGKHKRNLDRVGKPQVTADAISDDGAVDVRALMSGIDIMSWQAAKRDAVWAMVIERWSYDLPVPVLEAASGEVTGADAFGELPLKDFEELEALLAPFEETLNQRPDPKGATTSASNGSSRASGAHGSRRG
jgi:hypothetical protein